jgi:CheY-like chemotaxis protein
VARTILIVDDNRATRDALRAVLQTKGYAVAEAADGPAALTYLQRGGAADAIVLDLHMPGMSGYEVHEQLKQDPALASIPVVVFSALTAISGRDDGRREGIVAYIRKAVHPDVLLQAIHRAVGSASP